MSDLAMEDALYVITSMRLFAYLWLDKPTPDHTTIMNFRHLLEKHKLSRQLFKEVNRWLPDVGIYLKEGSIVDVTIIEAASLTKNKVKERDPEMLQTQKGKHRFFDLKAHIGVDARTELTHSVSTAAANFHDITETANLLHGEECFVSADFWLSWRSKERRVKRCQSRLVNCRDSKQNKTLKKTPLKNKQPIRTEHLKASIRAKVEHLFRIIKCQFGFRKAIYRELAKNDSKLAMLFALANVF